MYTYLNKEQNHKEEITIYWFECDFFITNEKKHILGVQHENGTVTIINDLREDLTGSYYGSLVSDLYLYVTQEMINDY